MSSSATHPALKPAALMVWDVDGVLYPYNQHFWNMIYDAVAKAAVQLSAIDGAPPYLNYETARELAEESQKYYGHTCRLFAERYAMDPLALGEALTSHLQYDLLQPNQPLIQNLLHVRVAHTALTQNTPENANAIIQSVGLARWLPERVVHSTPAWGLPNKSASTEAFAHCLRAAGVAASQAIMIDDSIENLTQAKKLGMQTVWIDAKQRPHADADAVYASAADFIADYRARTLPLQHCHTP